MKNFFGRAKADSKSPLLRWQGKENVDSSPQRVAGTQNESFANPTPRLPFALSVINSEYDKSVW